MPRDYDPDEPDGAFVVGACADPGQGFEVRDRLDRVIVTTHDEGSAVQYAVLLNAAFLSGYKLGFRAGRRR